MIYVALLRGINVGGKNKVSMQQLKAAFEDAGMKAVTTYINSGNVIFRDESHTPAALTTKLEATIEQEFGFAVKVLVRDINNIKAINKALPDSWANNTTAKCDVLFLWEAVSTPDVVKQLTIKPDIDYVKYVAGTILWHVDRKNVTKSGLLKIVGTDLYAHMTIRNANTTRKLLERMKLAQEYLRLGVGLGFFASLYFKLASFFV